mmetsp:Transcript_38216/g.110266  ORF Transcript_38216/g.110266 Transcript_38216/m.110266 type:complete len:208 (+) Transcript_38216:1231-1854(+)
MWWSSAITSTSQPSTSGCEASAKVMEYAEYANAGKKYWLAKPANSKISVACDDARVIAGTVKRLRISRIGGCQIVHARSSGGIVRARYVRALRYCGCHRVSASPTVTKTRDKSQPRRMGPYCRRASRYAHWVFDDFPTTSPGRFSGWYVAKMSAKRCCVAAMSRSAFSRPAGPSRASIARMMRVLLRAIGDRPKFSRVSLSIFSFSL